jgi:hypothetical protein
MFKKTIALVAGTTLGLVLTANPVSAGFEFEDAIGKITDLAEKAAEKVADVAEKIDSVKEMSKTAEAVADSGMAKVAIAAVTGEAAIAAVTGEPECAETAENGDKAAETAENGDKAAETAENKCSDAVAETAENGTPATVAETAENGTQAAADKAVRIQDLIKP